MIRYEASNRSGILIYETSVVAENDKDRVIWVGNDGLPWSLPPSGNIPPIITGIEDGDRIIIDTCQEERLPRLRTVDMNSLGLSAQALSTLNRLFNP